MALRTAILGVHAGRRRRVARPSDVGVAGLGKPGASRRVWLGARRVGGQVAAPAYGRRRRRGAGRREVGEAVSGSFVIRPKFQNPVL